MSARSQRPCLEHRRSSRWIYIKIVLIVFFLRNTVQIQALIYTCIHSPLWTHTCTPYLYKGVSLSTKILPPTKKILCLYDTQRYETWGLNSSGLEIQPPPNRTRVRCLVVHKARLASSPDIHRPSKSNGHQSTKQIKSVQPISFTSHDLAKLVECPCVATAHSSEICALIIQLLNLVVVIHILCDDHFSDSVFFPPLSF
jgi:hypothetical protein